MFSEKQPSELQARNEKNFKYYGEVRYIGFGLFNLVSTESWMTFRKAVSVEHMGAQLQRIKEAVVVKKKNKKNQPLFSAIKDWQKNCPKLHLLRNFLKTFSKKEIPDLLSYYWILVEERQPMQKGRLFMTWSWCHHWKAADPRVRWKLEKKWRTLAREEILTICILFSTLFLNLCPLQILGPWWIALMAQPQIFFSE